LWHEFILWLLFVPKDANEIEVTDELNEVGDIVVDFTEEEPIVWTNLSSVNSGDKTNKDFIERFKHDSLEKSFTPPFQLKGTPEESLTVGATVTDTRNEPCTSATVRVERTHQPKLSQEQDTSFLSDHLTQDVPSGENTSHFRKTSEINKDNSHFHKTSAVNEDNTQFRKVISVINDDDNASDKAVETAEQDSCVRPTIISSIDIYTVCIDNNTVCEIESLRVSDISSQYLPNDSFSELTKTTDTVPDDRSSHLESSNAIGCDVSTRDHRDEEQSGSGNSSSYLSQSQFMGVYGRASKRLTFMSLPCYDEVGWRDEATEGSKNSGGSTREQESVDIGINTDVDGSVKLEQDEAQIVTDAMCDLVEQGVTDNFEVVQGVDDFVGQQRVVDLEVLNGLTNARILEDVNDVMPKEEKESLVFKGDKYPAVSLDDKLQYKEVPNEAVSTIHETEVREVKEIEVLDILNNLDAPVSKTINSQVLHRLVTLEETKVSPKLPSSIKFPRTPILGMEPVLLEKVDDPIEKKYEKLNKSDSSKEVTYPVISNEEQNSVHKSAMAKVTRRRMLAKEHSGVEECENTVVAVNEKIAKDEMSKEVKYPVALKDLKDYLDLPVFKRNVKGPPVLNKTAKGPILDTTKNTTKSSTENNDATRMSVRNLRKLYEPDTTATAMPISWKQNKSHKSESSRTSSTNSEIMQTNVSNVSKEINPVLSCNDSAIHSTPPGMELLKTNTVSASQRITQECNENEEQSLPDLFSDAFTDCDDQSEISELLELSVEYVQPNIEYVELNNSDILIEDESNTTRL